MKNTLKTIALSLGLTLGFAVAAQAQAVPTGTVDFSVTVPEAYDIRSNGTVTVTAGITATAQTANNALATTLTVLDASPNVDNSILTANVPIRLRSNDAYLLTATRTGSSVAHPANFDSSDISMSISAITRSGANVAAGTDTAQNGFGAPGKTVADLSGTATNIMTGSRISNQGNNDASSANFATGTLNFSIARQYYTANPVAFTEQVTVGIVGTP